MKTPNLSKTQVADVVIVQIFAVVAIGWLNWPENSGDMHLYFESSQGLLEGKIPYRDFHFEYPPLAIVPVIAPRLATLGLAINIDDYYYLFLLQNALLSAGTTLVMAGVALRLKPPINPVAVAATHALFVAIFAPLLPWRYDEFPALLTALALLAVVQKRPALAGLWLGLGTAAKLYPLVLVGLFGAFYLGNRDRRSLARLVSGSMSVVVLAFATLRFLAPQEWFSFLTYHQRRGIEIGSTAGASIWLANTLGLAPARAEFNYGAVHVVSPAGDALLPWQIPIMLFVVGGVILLYLRRFVRERQSGGDPMSRSLVSGVVAVLLAFIIANKVFSPQFLIWVLPFAALLRAKRVVVFIGIGVATMYVFPFNFSALVAGNVLTILVLNLRNVLVLAIFLSLLWERPWNSNAIVPAQ